MSWFYLFAPLVTGGLLALQGVLNSAGSRATSTPLMIAGLSLIQMIPSLVFLLFQAPSGLSTSSFVTHGLKWFIPAGLIGILGITVVSVSISKVGALPVFVLVFLGQIVGSAVADQFGLFGNPKVPINSLRMMSIVIIITGVVLLLKSGSSSFHTHHPNS